MIPLNTIALLTSPLFTLFLFGYVYGQRRKNRLNHTFLVLAGTYFLLTFCDFMFRVIPPGFLRHVLLEVATSLFFIASFVFLDFMYAFVKRPRDKYLAFFGVEGIIGMVIPFLNIPLHDDSSLASPGFSVPLPNWLFGVIFVIYIFPVTIFGIILALNAYRVESDREDKKRLLIWIGGMGAAFLYLVGVCFIFPRLFKMPILSSFVSLAIIIIDLFMYWSVRRYNFLTVNINQLEEILDKVFRDVGDSVLLIDQRRKIVRANDAATKLFDIRPESIGSLSVNDIIPEIGLDHFLNNFETEVQLSGERRSITITKTNLRAADESLQHMLTIRDITKIKRAEEDRLRIQKLETLGILAGGIAHDFNNFLCGIVSSFGLASMGHHSEAELKEILAEGERTALSARSLTHQLLTFAKGGEPVCENIDILPLIQGACTFAARGSHIKLEFCLPDHRICINADDGQIRQVFHNIVMNACQATPEGGVVRVLGDVKEITSDQLLPLRTGRYFEIKVVDPGCGISPQVLPRIFEPYFSTKKEGSGLGLAIAYSIVQKHNGYIAVVSKAGSGSVFSVFLPVSPIDKSEANKSSNKEEMLPNKGKVLIMDDVKVIRMTLSMLLKRLGYVVDESSTGEEALQRFDETLKSGSTYRFVITDLTVPGGMGGRLLAQKIAVLAPEVPVIVTSGYSEDMEIARYKDFGFAGVLRKPYNLSELKKAIESVEHAEKF
ncbi:MAG: ATP-binding protein [Chitinivibrionales bacterium]|nr:ATP-binding protein [Chitinivibrionales bacterium]